MTSRRVLLAALIVLVALAAPTLGRTAPDAGCMGNRNVVGWSTSTVRCTIATAGDRLDIRATVVAAGAYTSFLIPFPSIVNAGVSIKTLDGVTLLSCSRTDMVLAQCGRQMQLNLPIGTPLTCEANGWTNMHYGAARLAYACMST